MTRYAVFFTADVSNPSVLTFEFLIMSVWASLLDTAIPVYVFIYVFVFEQPQLLAAVKFIAHLVNQQVAHEIIALELLTVLLEKPTDDSVEVAVGFVTDCGSILQDVSPKGLHGGYSIGTVPADYVALPFTTSFSSVLQCLS